GRHAGAGRLRARRPPPRGTMGRGGGGRRVDRGGPVGRDGAGGSPRSRLSGRGDGRGGRRGRCGRRVRGGPPRGHMPRQGIPGRAPGARGGVPQGAGAPAGLGGRGGAVTGGSVSWLVGAAATAFAIALLLGPTTIAYLRRFRVGQQVRDDGPRRHQGKAGTPTMGGVLIVFAATAATVAFAPSWRHIPYALAVMVGYGLIGLADDALKVIYRRSLGLRAREKLLGQLILAGVLAAYGLSDPQLGSQLRVPFSAHGWDVPGWLYLALTVAAVIGTANAVNLTDGLDGLAAGATAIASFSMAAIAWMVGNAEAALLAAAVGGACLGFSWYNAHPAQVFMGDTGSLALGA